MFEWYRVILSMKDKAQRTLEVSNLAFSYGKYTAVKDVSFEVKSGEVFGLLGTNGAGKTTTLEIIEGFKAAKSGTVRCFGLDPSKSPGAVRSRTGIVLQTSGFFNEMSVQDTLSWWGSISGRQDREDQVLESCGLANRARSSVGSLSGGEKRRLDLAMAIWGSPELIILDEPTTGLDPESRQMLWSLVEQQKDRGASVILTTHYLDEAERLCDRIAIMHEGSIVARGTLEELRDSGSVTGYISVQGPREEFDRLVTPMDLTMANVSGSPEHCRYEFQDAQLEPLTDLIAEIHGSDVLSITELSVRPRNLEEIFMGIARGQAGKEEV